jgi:hypothetical protein
LALVGSKSGGGIAGYTWDGPGDVVDLPIEIAEPLVARHLGFYFVEVEDEAPGEVVAEATFSEVTPGDPPEIEPPDPHDLTEALDVSNVLKPITRTAKKVAPKG